MNQQLCPSSNPTHLNEYRKFSEWNLFQKKSIPLFEVQSKSATLPIRRDDIEKNPPNPVVRPLLIRPQARDEPTFLSREKNHSIYMGASRCNTLKSNKSSSSMLNESKNDEYMIWKRFIFAYAQNMYDLSNPPSPPAALRTPFFIPPRPFNESERLAALRSYNILPYDYHKYKKFPHSNVSIHENTERLQRLVTATRDFFSTSIALISLIDDNRCYFKCEVGIDISEIDRDITFCTHTILCSEPMIILDASKDWRFKGNPLVINPPYLRFYAGASIITPSGYPIGTISVMDSNARLFFSPQDLRPLSQFARMAMEEIEHLSQINKTKNSLDATIQKMSLRSSDGFPEADPALLLNEYQMISNDKNVSENSTKKSIPEYIYLNPDETLKTNSNQNMRGNSQIYSKANELSGIEDSTNFYIKMSSDSKTNEKRQIVSDSYKFNSLQNSPLSQIRFNKEQKSKVYSMDSKDKITFTQDFSDKLENKLHHNENNFIESNQDLLNNDRKGNVQILKGSELTPPSTPVNSKINFINSIDNISKEKSTINLQAYPFKTSHLSAFATHVIACTLGLDLVYIVQISPDNSASLKPWENAEKSSVVSLNIVASWGLPSPPPVLDPALHLRALRSEGGLIYRNPLLHLNEECFDYKVGILIPLWRDDINEFNADNSLKDLLIKSTSGVVLAGFAKKERTNKGFSSDEIHYLRKFGGVLEKVLKLSNTK